MTNQLEITVYSKPACVACNQTYKALDRSGAVYNVINLADDPAALDTVKDLGYMQAPVVIVKDTTDGTVKHWSGFRLDKITETVN